MYYNDLWGGSLFNSTRVRWSIGTIPNPMLDLLEDSKLYSNGTGYFEIKNVEIKVYDTMAAYCDLFVLVTNATQDVLT